MFNIMKNAFNISAFILISLLVYSCSEKSPERIDIMQLYDCYKSQNYDSAKLAASLPAPGNGQNIMLKYLEQKRQTKMFS